MLSRENLGLLLGLLGMSMFAGTLPANRIAVVDLDPWFLTAGRASLAGLASLVILSVLRRPWPAHEQIPGLVTVFLCLVAGFPFFTAIAMQTVPVAHGGVVLGIMPIASAIAATLLAGERPSLKFWGAALCGSAIVVAFALRDGADGLVMGDAWLIAAMVSAAVGYSFSARLSVAMPGWEVIAWALVVTLPASLPASILLWPADAAGVSWQSWAALVYVAAFSQVFGFYLFAAGLAVGGVARVGQVQLLQPFMIVGLAAGINREPIDLATLLFAAAVVVSVAVGSRMPVKR